MEYAFLLHGYVDSSACHSIILLNAVLPPIQLYTDLNHYFIGSSRHLFHLFVDFLKNDCFSYFWKHDTETWIVDRSVKKTKFRIKQFCVWCSCPLRPCFLCDLIFTRQLLLLVSWRLSVRQWEFGNTKESKSSPDTRNFYCKRSNVADYHGSSLWS